MRKQRMVDDTWKCPICGSNNKQCIYFCFSLMEPYTTITEWQVWAPTNSRAAGHLFFSMERSLEALLCPQSEANPVSWSSKVSAKIQLLSWQQHQGWQIPRLLPTFIQFAHWPSTPGASQVAQCCKESPCQCRRHSRCGFNPWLGKMPWRRKWQPIPVFLPGESHGQRNLEAYSPWDYKESDTTERLSTQHAGIYSRGI